MLDALKPLALALLAVPHAILLLFALLVGALATLFGLSGTELMLEYFGAATGPITLMQMKLMLFFSFVMVLSFIPCREWVRTPPSHIILRLCTQIRNSASMGPQLAASMFGSPYPSNRFNCRPAYGENAETGRTAFLFGDRPQLE